MPEQISSYRLESELARGGMGIVYRGVHTVFEEVVAIKAIFPELTLNPELRARFVNEAKIQRRLQHPNIVQIREFLVEQGRFYIVMDLIEGETLAERLKRLAAPLPVKEALAIFRQALQGLGFAHAQGVIHRDVKPSNIMLTREGVAKLTDFGIARAVGIPGLTRTGTALGTPAYMAPEQVQGHKLDHRADIYSLGVTLYEMVAGRVPFEKPKDSDSDFEVLRAHIEQPPLPPSRLILTIPPFVEAAILKAMAKLPEERFASCEEFEAALVPQELPATRRVIPPSQPSVALRPATRERAAAPKALAPQRAPAKMKIKAGYWWAVVLLAAALAVGGYWLYRVRPGPSPTGEPPATRQTPRAPVVDRPAERPGSVPSQPLPAQPSAAELAVQVQPLINQAKAALDRGEYDAAIAAYRRALDLDSTNQEARRGIDRAQRAKAAEGATQKPPPTAPGMAEGGLVLQVAATERAFVAVDVDGKTALQQVLNPGEIHTLKAKESFDVITGNAQGIILTLNGETLKPLGRRGEVKSVHLTQNDLKKTSP